VAAAVATAALVVAVDRPALTCNASGTSLLAGVEVVAVATVALVVRAVAVAMAR
jgi:hypothetical protein